MYSKLIFTLICISVCHAYWEYQKDDKKTTEGLGSVNLRSLDRPFRIARLNLLWDKALHRLSEKKLRDMFVELKEQDKEEIDLKHIKAKGEDKDGMKEAKVRRRLKGIMKKYDLLHHYTAINDQDNYIRFRAMNDPDRPPKALFSDKKLNKLWYQAEHAGFTPDELKVLREEFQHHQDKIDQYHALFSDVDKHENAVGFGDDDDFDRLNEANIVDEKNKMLERKSEVLRAKHSDIRDGFLALQAKTSRGPLHKTFSEPKVEALWQTALHSNFTEQELESLYNEFNHYNKRLVQLQKLQKERNIVQKEHELKKPDSPSPKAVMMEERMNHEISKVIKIHNYLEDKISKKHMEL